jgi:hypothetical protein
MLRLIILLILPLSTALLGAGRADATEQAPFEVLARDGAFELRQYPAMLAAETLVTGVSFDDAGDVAFGRLFRYITGNNRARAEIAMTSPVLQAAAPAKADGEKIAMTTPVLQQPGQTGDPAGAYRVAFIVPASYTRETVPEPLDPAVRIVSIPGRLVAALTYSGWTSQALNDKQVVALQAELARRQLTAAGPPITAQYDAPFVPGPFRHNEVLMPVTRKAASPP